MDTPNNTYNHIRISARQPAHRPDSLTTQHICACVGLTHRRTQQHNVPCLHGRHCNTIVRYHSCLPTQRSPVHTHIHGRNLGTSPKNTTHSSQLLQRTAKQKNKNYEVPCELVVTASRKVTSTPHPPRTYTIALPDARTRRCLLYTVILQQQHGTCITYYLVSTATLTQPK